MLADPDTGKFSGDASKGAANLAGRVGFGIPHVEVTGTAGKPEEDDAFLAFGLAGFFGFGLLLQEPGQ